MLGRRLSLVALALGVAAASTVRADEDVGSAVSAIVYGADDRLDWYQIPDATMKSLGRDSVVALMPAMAIDLVSPGVLYPPLVDGVPTLSEAVGAYYNVPLCAGERFSAQPAAAICSGTLIDDDLVLTAGHCTPTQAACETLRFVFDYHEIADGTLETIDSDDVYDCKRILVRDERQRPHIDYAVIQLDRPVVGRTPVAIGPTQTAVAAATPLRVLGFGWGLPMKYDAGGSVFASRATELDAFVTNTDTFMGNSGSGVFTEDGTLVGILVSGQEDYVVGACTAVNEVADAQAGEECTYAFRAVDALCAGGFPTSLCPSNPAPSCGDHYCSGGEDVGNCATDCAGPHCADGTCSPSLGEDQDSCPYDCQAASPTYRSGKGRCTVSSPGARDDALVAVASLSALALFSLARRRSRC